VSEHCCTESNVFQLSPNTSLQLYQYLTPMEWIFDSREIKTAG